MHMCLWKWKRLNTPTKTRQSFLWEEVNVINQNHLRKIESHLSLMPLGWGSSSKDTVSKSLTCQNLTPWEWGRAPPPHMQSPAITRPGGIFISTFRYPWKRKRIWNPSSPWSWTAATLASQSQASVTLRPLCVSQEAISGVCLIVFGGVHVVPS